MKFTITAKTEIQKQKAPSSPWTFPFTENVMPPLHNWCLNIWATTFLAGSGNANRRRGAGGDSFWSNCMLVFVLRELEMWPLCDLWSNLSIGQEVGLTSGVWEVFYMWSKQSDEPCAGSWMMMRRAGPCDVFLGVWEVKTQPCYSKTEVNNHNSPGGHSVVVGMNTLLLKC